MLKRIVQNKYKLMVFIIGLYLLTDVLLHKGQTRVLFPKTFATYKAGAIQPQSRSIIINRDKVWKKGVNTSGQLSNIEETTSGI